MRVVVVGAGLAGLAAAESLATAGVEVVLVEVGRRVGGRARTVRDRFIAGHHAESGAEWVDTTHWRVHELMNRFGLSTVGEAMRWTAIRRWLFWDGRLYADDRLADLDPQLVSRLERYEATVDAPATELSDPSDPTSHPRARELDGRSLHDAIVEAGLTGPSELLARRNSQGEFADEPRNVSLLFVAQQRAQERESLEFTGQREVRALRVGGGVSSIAERWGGELSRHPLVRLRLSHRLVAVEQDPSGVRVELVAADGRHVVECDHLVLATSLVPLRSVHFVTPMPRELFDAVHGLSYGDITKTAVQFERRDWLPGYGTTESVAQRVYDCSIDQPGDAGILMAYCGGDGGRRLAGVDEDERIRVISDDMRRVHGITPPVVGSFSRSWSADDRYGGAYAVYGPGQVTAHWNVLRRPWGRVHLAGEHAATCTGYMEGAIESGRTVAGRLIV